MERTILKKVKVCSIPIDGILTDMQKVDVIYLITKEEYMSMILSNKDIINSHDVIKDLFFDDSPSQLFRVIK